MKRLCGVFLTLMLLVFSSTLVVGQEDTCPTIVRAALDLTADVCASIERNELCYGNLLLQAQPFPGESELTFENVGDRVNIAAVESLTVSPMDQAHGLWGVALMRIQANLPDTLPGQNLSVVLFGDVELTNVGSAPRPTVNGVVQANANLRSGPGTDFEIVGTLTAGETVTLEGRLEDDSWLRVVFEDGGRAWLFASLITLDGELATLNVIEPDDQDMRYKPMQAFYFQSGIGDAPCQEAPESGILIQTPEGARQVRLLVNEVQLTLSSAVFLQANAPGELIIYGVEDLARVDAFETARIVHAGTRLSIPLDVNGAASGPPGDIEPYDLDSLQNLPFELLERSIALVPPLEATSFTDAEGDTYTCDRETAVDDHEVDVTRVMVSRSANHDLMAEVYLLQPLVNDYSFAVQLYVGVENNFNGYLWEVHANRFRIGAINTQTGRLLSTQPDDLVVEHNQTGGMVLFNIPAAELPAVVNQIKVRSFHTPNSAMQPQPAHCDQTDWFDLPSTMR